MARNETEREKRIRQTREELANARAAVESLPVIEEQARARVADAGERLRIAQEQLKHVLEVERPATEARVPELEQMLRKLGG